MGRPFIGLGSEQRKSKKIVCFDESTGLQVDIVTDSGVVGQRVELFPCHFSPMFQLSFSLDIPMQLFKPNVTMHPFHPNYWRTF
jgi:hypothetical protein